MATRSGVSRRQFIKAGMGMAVTTALAACAAAPVTQLEQSGGDVSPAAAASPQPITAQAEIRFGTFASEALLPVYRRILLPRFADAHPEITINFETGPWSEYMTKQTTQIAAGDLPDVFINPNYDLPAIYTRGVLLDFNPFVEGDDEIKAVIPESAWGLFMDADQHRWAAPTRVGGNALAYNEVLFDEAGLEYPNPDWTSEDFLEAAVLLTKDENGRNPTDSGFDDSNIKQYGYWARNYGTTDYGCQSYGFGGSWYKDPGVNLEPNFTDPNTIAGFQWTIDLLQKHKVSPGLGQMEGFGPVSSLAFIGGHCAMHIAHQGQEGSWPVGEWNQEKWKNGNAFQVTWLPKWPARRCNLVAGQGFCIPSYSQNKEAAWTFVRFGLLDVPYQAGQTDPGKYTLPANRKAWEEPNVLQRESPPLTNQRAFVEALEEGWDGYMWNFDPSPVWLDNWMSITNTMALVWEGELGVEEALQAVQKECEQHAADYRASL